MFNNLNNASSQNHQEVDDIFAETDRQQSQSPANSGIETRRVGLNSEVAPQNEAPVEKSGNGKALKIILVIVVISILGLGGYLVYSKFLKKTDVSSENNLINGTNTASTTKNTTPVAEEETAGSLVVPVSEQTETATGSVATTTNEDAASSSAPLIPGVNAPTTETEPASKPVSNVDSDLDGLSDTEESIAGSNPNVIDSDVDGLSDYEEVKIYNTNPNNSDTDGDGYLDAAEIRSGYNPNGPGKLTGAAQ